MRLLHIVDSRQLRGAEMFAFDLIKALNGAGVSQRVGVLRDVGGPAVSFDAPAYPLGSDGWTVPGLRIRPSTLRMLQGLIRKWRPDIIQAHGGDSLKYVIPAVTGARTLVVYRKIGLTPSDSVGHLKVAGHGVLMRRSNRVVAVGDAVRREVVEVFRVPKERTVTIPNAVDSSRLRQANGQVGLREAFGIPPTSPIILSLGALTWEKDPLRHVDISARVLRRYPEAVHLMVGDGPLRPQVEAAIQKKSFNGQIRLLPARADAPDLLAMSDVMLLASRTEGMPGSVIEAGMMGVAVAAYAVASIPEVVVDGVTGRLAPSGDVDQLTGIVMELLANPIASRAMGDAARKRCLSRFDIRVIAPRYLELYEELLTS